jgi:hypothetical protein
MNSSKHVSLKSLVISAMVMISGLLLAPAGNAETVVISGRMEGNLPINPGDKIQAGYSFTAPGSHDSTTITVGGNLLLPVVCSDNSIQTVTINFPTQSYSVPANNGNWMPSADQNFYQAYGVAPSNLCGGKKGFASNGATFTATFSCHTECITAQARFHYCNRSAGSWSPTVNCLGWNGKECISGPCKCKTD